MVVEVKVREFRSKLLLAAVLAQRGFRVYVGSRSAIGRAIRQRHASSGVYFMKGGEDAATIAAFARQCAMVVGQDEEIGPALTTSAIEDAVRTRIPGSVSTHVDRWYVYSDEHRRVIESLRPDLASRLVVTGWPREDLWRQEFRRSDEAQARQIRRDHGDFVLFVSNFKVTSTAQRDRSLAVWSQRIAASDVPDADVETVSRAQHRFDAFVRTVDLLKQVSAEVPNLIVRPHPVEDPATWTARLAGTPGVKVISEGEVGPWLLASRAMLHTGCTTAAQAARYGLPCGFLEQVGLPPADFPTSHVAKMSKFLPDTDAVRQFVQTAIEDADALNDGVMHEFNPQQACDLIADDLASLEVEGERPLARRRLVTLRRVVLTTAGRLRRATGVGKGSFVGTSAQRKLAGGLHKDEARSILADLAVDADLTVNEPRFDVISVETAAAGRRRSQ